MTSWAIYGGTFDPVHNGHILTAETIQQQFKFANFVFLPCKIPVLKKAAIASSEQRLTMLELALQESNITHYQIDEREIKRAQPSYTYLTLKEYREEKGNNASITFILGIDAFANFNSWYKALEILSLSNILIIERSGFCLKNLPKELNTLLKKYQQPDFNKLPFTPSGAISYFNAGNIAISSSLIRKLIHQNKNWQSMVEPSVAEYIIKKNIDY